MCAGVLCVLVLEYLHSQCGSGFGYYILCVCVFVLFGFGYDSLHCCTVCRSPFKLILFADEVFVCVCVCVCVCLYMVCVSLCVHLA